MKKIHEMLAHEKKMKKIHEMLAHNRTRLSREFDFFGDILFLDKCLEGSMASARCKTLEGFKAVIEKHESATFVFKQDTDTLVDWRVILPRMLEEKMSRQKKEVSQKKDVSKEV